MTASSTEAFLKRFEHAVAQRERLLASGTTSAARVFSGAGDGADGIYVDMLGPGAVIMVYEGRAPSDLDLPAAASGVLHALRDKDVRAVYVKPFAKDRSRMGGELPPSVTDAAPAAGEPLPEAVLVHEHGMKLEIRHYDGLSTGLFLDQRENRRWVGEWVRQRIASGGAERGRGLVGQRVEGSRFDGARPPGAECSVLNTFAYTCGFSVAAALAGALTASVDVSGRYLDWGKRNFAHNGIDIGPQSVGVDAAASPTSDAAAPERWSAAAPAPKSRGVAADAKTASASAAGNATATPSTVSPAMASASPPSRHRFAKMDTFEFLTYARKKSLLFDLIVLDPPSFASGSKKKGVKAWSSVDDYDRLVHAAAEVLKPRGVIFASTNTQELCKLGRLEREIEKGLGYRPRWLRLPEPPSDFASDRERFAARAFEVR
jgi:23S rRNA G2069 N7-methylase RlmK/C1962 C5-methylase RlmI